MQSIFSTTPSSAPRDAFAHRLAIGVIVAAIVVATTALFVQRAGAMNATLADGVVPLHVSVAFTAILCAMALLALEFQLRVAASLCVAPAVVAVTATIIAWIFGLSPPFGVTLFGEPGVAPSWFPSPVAIEAAIPTALASLAIFTLIADRLLWIVAPFAWATGILLIVAPPLRLLMLNRSASVSVSAEILTTVTLVLLGIALVSVERVREAAWHDHPGYRGNRGARWRALLAVAAIAATVAMWYAVRATEVRQLDGDVDIALEETARALQNGIANSSGSADRLWQHWNALRWQVPDELFVSDSVNYMRRQVAVSSLAMLDTQGRILKAVQRRTRAGAEPSESDPIELVDKANPPWPLSDEAGRTALVRTSLGNNSPAAGTPNVADTGVLYIQVVAPIVDDSGKQLGAFWLMFRPDATVARILADAALDFHIGIRLQNRSIFERAPRDGVYPHEERFRRVATRDMNGSRFTFVIAPGEKIVSRALGWTPLLVLLFAWTSLFLFLFALYNERRAAALLRERERILNQSLDLICTLRGDGVFVTANDAAQRLLGVPAHALPGRSLLEFIPEDQREVVARTWLAQLPETQTPSTQFIRQDRRPIFLQAVSRWSVDEQLLYCAIRDVSAEHELNVRRRHGEDTFRIGVEQAGCAVYELQTDAATSLGRIEWVGAIRTLTGYEPAELSDSGFEGWMSLIHPDDAVHVRRILLRCLETNQPHTVDYRLRRKDGVYVPVLDRGRHLTDLGSPRMVGALIDLTAIRQQEVALRRSEERYRIIAGQVGAVIVERETASGRIKAFGPVEQIFGYTKEQLEARPMTRDDTMIHPDDRAHYFAAVEQAERTLSTYYVEHRRRHRGGHYIHIASRGVVLAGADGRAEREVIAITDISERKSAETRLLESEERFRLAAEQARQIVYEFVFDDRMRIVELRFAGATEQVLGYTQADLRDLQSQDRFALIHPDDIPAVRDSGSGSLATTYSFNVEHRVRHRNGQFVYTENRGAVKRDSNGKITGIVGMLLDITARRSAEAERQHYTSQLRALADIAHNVGTVLSLHELLKYLATSMRALLGTNAASALVFDATLAPVEVVAVSYAESYGIQRGPPTALASAKLQTEVRSSNTARRYTAKQMTAEPELAALTQHDDLRHPLRGWLGAPLIGRDGANLGLLEVSDKIDGDFTEGDLQVLNQLAGLASVAIENIRLYATLEERVAARTLELEISNRELEAFSYSVSHDLRAPLRAIAGFSNILETEYMPNLDSAARRYLQRITAGVERMANLIDDLLSLARVSRIELKRETVDLTALAKAVLKRQTERAGERAVDIVVDTKMKVIADPRLIEVALENLVENALKFTGRRTDPRVHVGQRRIDGRLAFYVADNGVGFDPKYASNLFGVFQRLHSASEFPGTGVGLATVQRIVQRHHGRIWAEADVDRGATFYFTLTSEN